MQMDAIQCNGVMFTVTAETWVFITGDFPAPTGDLFTEAAEAAMEAMKGRLANQYYMKAEEAWVLMEEEEEE